MKYLGKISLSSEEQPKEGYISKNCSRGLFTVRDEISGRKSLQFCLGFWLVVFCLLGFVSFGSLGWFWEFLLGVFFSDTIFSMFPAFELKMLRVDEPILPNFNNPPNLN